MVKFAPWSLYPLGKSLPYTLNRSLGGYQSQYGRRLRREKRPTRAEMRTDICVQPSVLSKLVHSGFGGLEVACWPLVPKFAGSNPAEAVGFFRAKKSSARLPSEGK